MSNSTDSSFAALSEAFVKLSTEAQTKVNQEWKLLQETKKKLSKQEQSLQEQIQKMKVYNFEESDIIELNVGGNHFSTTISTLRRIPPNLFSEEDQGQLDEEQQTATDEGNILSIIASGNFPITKDKQGRIFLDRNGVYFGYILDYLRENGDLKRACIPFKNQEMVEKLCIECDHFCLNRMKYLLLNQVNYSIVKNPINWISNSDCSWLKNRINEMNKKIGPLLYKGSRDGFTAAKFHELCDNKGETISIIKSNDNCIFGGYNSNPWTSQNNYTPSSTNWLFCFANKLIKQPTQFKLNGNSNHNASYNGRDRLCAFGTGHDLYICDSCNAIKSSHNTTGNSYHNNGVQHGLNGGLRNFTVVEIEVYQIVPK